ncbi:unnamed protein product [Ectocarpus sp. 12 AP-2014]
MGLAVPTRPVLRRVSSAVLADEAAVGRNGGGGGGGGSGMMDQRRLVSPTAAECNDGQQRSSAVALEAVATLRPALTQAFMRQDLAEREARPAACAKLPREDGETIAAAARADDKGTRDPWVWEASPRPPPPPEPRPGPTETPAVVVACEGDEGVGNVAALTRRESKPERGCKSVLEEEGGGSVPIPAGPYSMSVAEKLKQARQMPEATGTYLPTQRGRTATGGTPAVAKEAGLVLAATAAADTKAAVDASAEKTLAKTGQVRREAAKSSEVDSQVEHKSSVFSRFSSVFSRRRHPPTVAKNDGTVAEGEVPAVPVATVKESRRGEEPAPPARESNEEAKEQPPAQATSAKAEAAREPSEDREPASPAAGRSKLVEEGPPAGGGYGEETTACVPLPDEGEGPEIAATATAADPPFSGSSSPAPSSGSSSLSAERADAAQDNGPMGSGIQVGRVAASPGREQPGRTPPRHRSRFSTPPAIITDPARKNGPIGLTSNGSKEMMASPNPPRFALTPPVYRCRLAAKPGAGRVVSPLAQGTSPQTGVEERKATMPPRRAGLTPPGYRSRSYSSSPSARRRASSPGQGSIAMAGEEGAGEPSSSARTRRTGLTPPGYRSRTSPPLAGRVDSRRRESAPAASPGVRSVLGASDAGGHVTPGRDKAKAPASEQRTGILGGTPTRRRAYSSPGLYSPGKGLRIPWKMRQERLGGRDGVGEETEKVVEGETSPGSLPEPSSPTQQQQERPVGDKEVRKSDDDGCSPVASGDGIQQGGGALQSSSPRIVDARPTNSRPMGGVGLPGVSSPTDQHQQTQDASCVPMTGDGSPRKAVSSRCSSPCTAVDAQATESPATGTVESPGASFSHEPRSHQHQGSGVETAAPAAAAAAAAAAPSEVGQGGEQEQEAPQSCNDAVCSPLARAFASPVHDSEPACTTSRLVAASTPRIAGCSASKTAVDDSGRGVDGCGGSSCGDAAAAAAVPVSASDNFAEAQAPPKENEQNLPEASQAPPMAGEGVRKEEEPEAVQAPPKADEGKGEEELPETFPCSPNFAAGFVAGRRKRRAVSGVPVVTEAAATAALSPVSAERRRASSGSKAPESSEKQESGLGESSSAESSSDESGSSWETCSSSEEEDGGGGVAEGEEGEGWGRLSYLDEIDEHPYGGVVVIDPDLVRSGGSSNGGGSARSSLPRSSFDDEARSGGRRSWTASPPTAEMSTQTTQGEEGVAHVLVQAGDGKLLSEAELQEEYTQRELRERLEMMNHDLLAEVFHREIVKQEEAQKRRKQQEAHEAEILALRDELHAVQMSHNNEKIKMRWEHADELARVEAEGGDVVGMRQELEEERKLREEDEKRHEAALQKERQHRREWEARSDEHVRDKREQAKQYREEMRRQVAAERKRAEGGARKKLEARHKEAQQKAEEVVKMQLKMIKEMDQENDELREENAELREKLGIEDDDEEKEEEGTEAG